MHPIPWTEPDVPRWQEDKGERSLFVVSGLIGPEGGKARMRIRRSVLYRKISYHFKGNDGTHSPRECQAHSKLRTKRLTSHCGYDKNPALAMMERRLAIQDVTRKNRWLAVFSINWASEVPESAPLPREVAGALAHHIFP